MNRTYRYPLQFTVLIALSAGLVRLFSQDNLVPTSHTATTKDREFEITTPPGWRQSTDIRFVNNLSIKDGSSLSYLVINSVKKEDAVFPDLESFDNENWNILVKKIGSATPALPERFVTCGPKGKGICRRIDTIENRYRRAYYFCSVECQTTYHRAVFSALKSDYEKMEKDYKDMIKSFQPAAKPVQPGGTGK